MGIGFKELIIILVIVLLLFGRGRITAVMGDIGKGIRSLRDGLKGEDNKPEEPKQLHKKDDTNTTTH